MLVHSNGTRGVRSRVCWSTWRKLGVVGCTEGVPSQPHLHTMHEDNFATIHHNVIMVKSNNVTLQHREKLLAYAFRALSLRALTEAELRTKLEAKQQRTEHGTEEDVSWVIWRVQELGYQNDDDIIYIETQRKDRGVHRIRQTLRRRGVAAEQIEQACLPNPDEERAQAFALLEPRWQTFTRKKHPVRSAVAFLVRRGFSADIAWSVVQELETT